MSYLLWLAIFFGIPLLTFFLIDFRLFINHKKIFTKIIIGSFIFAYPWDILAIAHRAWSFPQGLIGIYLLGLPLEEFLWGGMFALMVAYFTLLLLKQKYGK